MKDEELPPLKPGSKVALRKVEIELRKGFSGTFTIECRHGGIRDVQQSTRWQPTKDEDAA